MKRTAAPHTLVIANGTITFPTTSLSVREVATPVLLPALLVVAGAEGLFLAVTDRLYAIATDSSLSERVLQSIRAACAQHHVVFDRATFVAVAFDGEANG